MESHKTGQEIYGTPCLEQELVNWDGNSQNLINQLIVDLLNFTGAGWEQEDDIP